MPVQLTPVQYPAQSRRRPLSDAADSFFKAAMQKDAQDKKYQQAEKMLRLGEELKQAGRTQDAERAFELARKTLGENYSTAPFRDFQSGRGPGLGRLGEDVPEGSNGAGGDARTLSLETSRPGEQPQGSMPMSEEQAINFLASGGVEKIPENLLKLQEYNANNLIASIERRNTSNMKMGNKLQRIAINEGIPAMNAEIARMYDDPTTDNTQKEGLLDLRRSNNDADIIYGKLKAFKNSGLNTNQRLKQEKERLDREVTRLKPETDIGKARKDLRNKVITQEDFNKIKNAPPEFKSPVGKLIGDKNAAISIFGEDSPQVKAFDELIADEAKGKRDLSGEKGIRGDYIKLSGDFVKLGDNFKKINVARSTPGGDVSLIFNFMKMLDPTSVVREGEQATAAAAGEVPDRVRNMYNRLIMGEKLSPKQREDFKAEAENIFASQMGAQLRREEEFTGIAERAGMNPKDIVLDFIGPFRKVSGTTKIGRFNVVEE